MTIGRFLEYMTRNYLSGTYYDDNIVKMSDF